MDELVKLVVQKTGISKEQATVAVNTVLGFLKDKLPEPLASQVDSVISGKSSPDDLMKGLGGMFGKKG
jgi:hypothetical protein